MTNQQKFFQTIGRPKGGTDDSWRPITYSGQRFYSDLQGLGNLNQMTAMLAANFPRNEYSISEVTI